MSASALLDFAATAAPTPFTRSGVGCGTEAGDTDQGDVAAIGVYNQLFDVDPPTNWVVVKLPANRASGTSTEDHANRDVEKIAFLRGIARGLGGART